MTKRDIEEIIKKNRDLMDVCHVKSIYLFGSYVRNEQKENSDIDLLVDFEHRTYKNYINLIYSLEDLFKKEVTVVTRDGISPYVRPYILKEAEKIEG